MQFISAEKISKSFGVFPLFNEITFTIKEGDKIALIARNGQGKSTLLKILARKAFVDEGKLLIAKDINVIFLEQNPDLDEEKTVLDNIFDTPDPVIQLLKKFRQASENPALKDELTTLTLQMEEAHAWHLEAKIYQILDQLNIKNVNEKITNLSGGQKKRVALAKVLLAVSLHPQQTLLILDEPTNHLDIEMIEWLENFLNKTPCTLLIVSHDRYFLDAICDRYWEIDNSVLTFFKGDYENYLTKKAALLDNLNANIDKAKNQYRKELEWMRKQPRARTTKSKSRQDNFYVIEAQANQKISQQALQLDMKMSRLGGKILELIKVSKAFGDKQIIGSFSYNFSKGERIGIIGKNGKGKSTLLNLLTGKIKPDAGKINLGETVVFGYYSQEGLVMKDNMRVIEYVQSIAEHFPLAKGGSLSAAQFLELFLFPPDKQYTYYESLSGGEKKRLQLLTILFSNPNFLILDEPTNDLDIPTLAVLENFLTQYQGCLLIVSHDRFFMDKVVDHLFIMEGEGKIKDFPGNFSDYKTDIKTNQEANKNKANADVKKSDLSSFKPILNTKKIGFKEKQELLSIEQSLPILEKEKENLMAILSRADNDFEKIEATSKSLQNLVEEIEKKELRWLELSDN